MVIIYFYVYISKIEKDAVRRGFPFEIDKFR